MTRTQILAALGVTGVLTAGILGFTDNAIRANKVQYIDFDKVVTATAPAYNARLTDASDAGIKEYRIPIKNAVIGSEFRNSRKCSWLWCRSIPGGAG